MVFKFSSLSFIEQQVILILRRNGPSELLFIIKSLIKRVPDFRITTSDRILNSMLIADIIDYDCCDGTYKILNVDFD